MVKFVDLGSPDFSLVLPRGYHMVSPRPSVEFEVLGRPGMKGPSRCEGGWGVWWNTDRTRELPAQAALQQVSRKIER